MGIPFTGPSAIACSNAYDKQRSIEILEKTGLNTPKAVTFLARDEINIPAINYPLFVKPQKAAAVKGFQARVLFIPKLI